MKRSTKYVALDVHQATTVISVREEGGGVIARTVLPTERGAILEYFRGMRGTIHVTFVLVESLRRPSRDAFLAEFPRLRHHREHGCPIGLLIAVTGV
jgi:hypothetical protein